MACSDADFAYLRAVVFEQSSNTMDASRNYLFESRLHPLLQATGLGTLDRLVAAMRQQPDSGIKRSVAEAMTVNETSFFRDRVPFELMQMDMLPALIERRASLRRLRLWSAACSTGQEAYSLAMMLCEHFPGLREWQVEIIGTDISADVIARAQTGSYQRLEVNRGLPARYLLKYMQRCGDEWEVIPEVRSLCRFYRRNLCNGPMLMEKYDGILLRNVMLYFSQETRCHLLLNLHRILAPDGFLILGASEQSALPEHFEPVMGRNACYYKPMNQTD
ncbi:MAG: protein-glutamate O-methyltransferase CheR [Silvibacterium sp.]